MAITNTGRLINFIGGITGVATGANAVINMDVNKRYHRLLFKCKALNFTGGVNLNATKITGAGTGLAVDATATNGVITAIVPHSGVVGTGFVTGDTITFADATGTGFVGTVTASGGAVTAIAITSTGTPTPINPATFFTAIKLNVNGVNMRDIAPSDIINIKIATAPLRDSGRYLATSVTASAAVYGSTDLGGLAIDFTEPARNRNSLGGLNAWDMTGQSTFQIQMQISGTVTSPQLEGIEEFDYARNMVNGLPYLQPIAQHSFTLPIVGGLNTINTIPFNWPISRMWLRGSTPGSITQFEVYADGAKVLESMTEELQSVYNSYGFFIGTGFDSILPVAGPFDVAFIADIDQNIGNALKILNSLQLRVYSAVAQTLTIVVESSPSAYTS